MHHFRHRSRLRLFAWIALWAAMALALVPSVSRALANSGGSDSFNRWATICSTSGGPQPHLAALALDDSHRPAHAGSLHLDHCPLCAVAATALLPPAAAAALQVPARADFMPALFRHAPRPLFAWRSAQPRGPPSYF